jgi:cell division protease FtsH
MAEQSERTRGPLTQSRLASDGKQDVGVIQEKSRRRRLWKALVTFGLLDVFVGYRVLHHQMPFPGPPDWFMLYLPEILLVGALMAMAVVMILPMLSGGSQARLVRPEEIHVGLDQVVGLDGQVDEVMRTLDVFLAYKTFRGLGGNPRRGILFEGPPGTGKTYLAKAMAKQAGVPFLFASASQFQNAYFGMTNVRIRRFFKKLRRAAQREGGAIGFIEEIDAIAQSRGGVDSMQSASANGRSVSNMIGPDNSGFVNELLVQMQSFDEPSRWHRFLGWFAERANRLLPAESRITVGGPLYHNVLVIAATNRASSLDPALMRPGRFDRRLYFDYPTKNARRDLIDFFLARKAHEADLDPDAVRERFAHELLGYTPAMLERLFDEALVVAVRNGREALCISDLHDARLTQELGLKSPVVYTDHERACIATHEAGHATAAYMLGTAERLEVLSIIKRRESLGLLARSDTQERFTRSRTELEGSIAIALGGMAAEEIYFGESTTGPGADLGHATSVAASMVGALGMGSSLLSFHAVDDGPITQTNLVGKVMADGDAKREAQAILVTQKERVLEVLGHNRDILESLRDALVERDELVGDEITDVINGALDRRKIVVIPEAQPSGSTFEF